MSNLTPAELAAQLRCSERALRELDCCAQYSVTSGTIFHGRKLTFTDMLVVASKVLAGTAASRIAQEHELNHRGVIQFRQRLLNGFSAKADTLATQLGTLVQKHKAAQ